MVLLSKHFHIRSLKFALWVVVLLHSPAIAEDCYILVVLLFTVARDRDSDSDRLLYFGRVIFFYFIFFSVYQIFAVPGPIFTKLYHTTWYVLK